MTWLSRAAGWRRRRAALRGRLWRRLVPAGLAAASTIGAAAGCGASDPPAPVAHTSIARHRAQRVARAVTIRNGDVPEFKTTAHPPRAGGAAEVTREVRCAHLKASWASALSDRLTAGSGYHVLGASSGVSVMPKPLDARIGVRDAAALDKRCLERAVRRGMASKLKVRGIVVKRVLVPVKGADASVAHQTIVGARGAPLVLYMDSVTFAYGQDLVTLNTYHSSKPVPPAMEERLLGLLVARARSHSR